MPDRDDARLNFDSNRDELQTLSNDATAMIAALSSTVRDLFSRPLRSGLHLVATPIGNLGDITPRALVTLAQADRIYCEDTRISAPMLARFGVQRRLATYHEHNAEAARREILRLVENGACVALISDAGMPAISDPGFKLARELIAAGHEVFVVPGPTALTAALTVSGLPTDRFFFAGFLPPKSAARKSRIEELATIPATLIFYELPHRVTAALADLADVLGPRLSAIARELTKKFEEVRRGTLPELAKWSAETPPRGEIAIVIAQADAEAAGEISDAAIFCRTPGIIGHAASLSSQKRLPRTWRLAQSRLRSDPSKQARNQY